MFVDGNEIVLEEEDIRRIDDLIATMNNYVDERRIDGRRSFALQEATCFVREWECIRRGGYTDYGGPSDDNDDG